MTAGISDEPKPSSSRLGRALRVFGDVRGKEALTAMLMTLNIFVVLVETAFPWYPGVAVTVGGLPSRRS